MNQSFLQFHFLNQSGGFASAWREIVAAVSRLEAPEDSRCSGCDRRNICGFCPPFLELEGGPEPPAFLCELGDRRRELSYSYP